MHYLLTIQYCIALGSSQTIIAIGRQQKLEEMEKRREVEEAEMEARRKELLSEEDGYWRQRMAQEARQQALQEGAIIRPNAQVSTLEKPNTLAHCTSYIVP